MVRCESNDNIYNMFKRNWIMCLEYDKYSSFQSQHRGRGGCMTI